MKRLCKTLIALSFVLLLSVLANQVESKAATRDQAVSWANSQLGKGLDYDGVYGNQCVDLIKYYYAYFGYGSYAMGNANAYISNSLPPGWTRVYSNYQPGDIAVWKTNHSCSTCNTGSYGHVGIITSADSTGFNAVNQNFNSKSYCTQNWFYCSALSCAIRPSYTASDSSKPSITNVKVTNVNAKGYTVTCTATDNVGVTTVKFPTWRVSDTSKDCTWYVGSRSGNTWSFTYTGAVFEDQYLTHIYAYDAAGNSTSASAGVVFCKRPETPTSIVNGGVYEIQSYLASNKVMDVANASKDDQANVHLFTRNNTNAQRFRIEHVKDGYYKLTAICSGKVLDICGAHRTNDGNLNQYSYNGSDAQLFRFVSLGNGYNLMISKLGSFVDLDAGATADCTNIHTWGYGSVPNQSWKLNLISAPATPTPAPTKDSGIVIGEARITFGTPVPTPTKSPSMATQAPTVAPTKTPSETPIPVLTRFPPEATEPLPTKEPVVNTSAKVNYKKPQMQIATIVKNLTVAKKKKHTISVKWEKSENTGYQIQCARNKKFTKNKKSKLIASNQVVINNLKANKTYYVRVRSYIVMNGKKVYSKWSSVKKYRL